MRMFVNNVRLLFIDLFLLVVLRPVRTPQAFFLLRYTCSSCKHAFFSLLMPVRTPHFLFGWIASVFGAKIGLFIFFLFGPVRTPQVYFFGW